jgi:hypothetical protein
MESHSNVYWRGIDHIDGTGARWLRTFVARLVVGDKTHAEETPED